jgi:hypothetical protein
VSEGPAQRAAEEKMRSGRRSATAGGWWTHPSEAVQRGGRRKGREKEVAAPAVSGVLRMQRCCARTQEPTADVERYTGNGRTVQHCATPDAPEVRTSGSSPFLAMLCAWAAWDKKRHGAGKFAALRVRLGNSSYWAIRFGAVRGGACYQRKATLQCGPRKRSL